MSNSVEIALRWDEDEALKASKLFYDYDMRHSIKRYIGWLFIAMMQFGIVAALKYNAYGLLIVSSFLVIYWYYGRWYLRSLFVKKYYQKKALQPTTLHIRCNKENIQIEKMHISWADVYIAIDTNSALLLQTKEEPLYIPYNAFENMDDLQKCLQLLKEKGKL